MRSRSALRHRAPQERSEIVSLRVTVTGMLEKPDLQRIKQGNEAPSPDAHTGVRKVSSVTNGWRRHGTEAV